LGHAACRTTPLKGFAMLRYLSDGIIAVALTLTWLAVLWVAVDLLIADPAVLVFEDLAIAAAVLGPILCAIGWGLRRLGRGPGGAVRRA
jgi:hypothetical protein